MSKVEEEIKVEEKSEKKEDKRTLVVFISCFILFLIASGVIASKLSTAHENNVNYILENGKEFSAVCTDVKYSGDNDGHNYDYKYSFTIISPDSYKEFSLSFIREGEHVFEKDETYSGKFVDDNNEFNYVFYQEVGH